MTTEYSGANLATLQYHHQAARNTAQDCSKFYSRRAGLEVDPIIRYISYNDLMLTNTEDDNNNRIEVKGVETDLEDLLDKMVQCEIQVASPFNNGRSGFGCSPLSSPKSVKLNRQTSWKTPKRIMRRVSFADSVGLELASIRIMTEGRDTPPDLERFHEVLRFGEKPVRRRQLQPLFMQPIQDYGSFYNRLKGSNLALESVAICNNIVNGVVKVKNIAYEKAVKIHYTTNGWKTKTVAPCYYINSLHRKNVPNHFDAFSFQLEVALTCDKLDFCIEYQCAGQTYWDNNRNQNYTIVSIGK